MCGGLDAETILVRARTALRDRKLPPFVVYTISRRETIDGEPDFDETYASRIWYRTADGAALSRRVEGGWARGDLVFEQPRFNAALDPGPPTADIFEPAPTQPLSEASAGPEASLKLIGSVSAHVELDYRSTIAACGRSVVQLRLEPRRDADRNRLRSLWLDRTMWAVKRFIATDRLYHGVTDIWDPDVFDGTLDLEGGIPVIRTIHAEADSTDVGLEVSDYRFDAISFPAQLPDWYFQPATYRAHAAEAPAW